MVRMFRIILEKESRTKGGTAGTWVDRPESKIKILHILSIRGQFPCHHVLQFCP